MEVDTDARDYRLGANLFQLHSSGERKPIDFWSSSLLPVEKKYCTPEKEYLEVVCALQTLRPYLQEEKLTVHNDQASLVYGQRWYHITECAVEACEGTIPRVFYAVATSVLAALREGTACR